MKKKKAILPIFLVIVAICVILVGINSDDKNEKKLMDLAQEHIDKNRAEEDRISNLNFYENISEQRAVNALIIGDSIAQSNGSSNADGKWFNLIIKDVQTKYKAVLTADLITGGGTTGIRGWVEINNAEFTKIYDIAFICLGQNDQWSVIPEQFKIFYESIIINLKKKNPNIEIIPIIQSSFREYNDYSNVIVQLSKHYNLQYADTLHAFNSSVEKYENLTKDVELPNNKGYIYYATTIEEIIHDNFISNKKTNIKHGPLYDNTSKLTNFTFDISPDLNNGFIIGQGLIGEKISDSLTFNTNNSVNIIHYLRQPKGGKFKVFMDGNFVKEIDTNSTFQVSYSDLISDNLEGQHKIKIEISSILKGQTVKILGLASN